MDASLKRMFQQSKLESGTALQRKKERKKKPVRVYCKYLSLGTLMIVMPLLSTSARLR